MQHSIKLSSGQIIKYWTYNEKASTTLILIHGFTGSHEGFQYIVPLLPDLRLIVPDIPGFGISPLPNNDSWTIDGIAAILNDFVKKLNIDKPILTGHSMGSIVVSSMIHQRPNLYNNKIILISPIPSAIKKHDGRKIGSELSLLQYNIGLKLPIIGSRIVKSKLISMTVSELLMTTKDRDLRGDIRKHHINNLNYITTKDHVRYYLNLEKDINNTGIIDYSKALRNLKVLLLAGEKDSVAPLALQKELSKNIKTPLKVIPGVDHLAHYETPTELAGYINDFLR